MLQLSLRLTDFSRLRPLILTVFWVRLSADDSKTLHEKKKTTAAVTLQTVFKQKTPASMHRLPPSPSFIAISKLFCTKKSRDFHLHASNGGRGGWMGVQKKGLGACFSLQQKGKNRPSTREVRVTPGKARRRKHTADRLVKIGQSLTSPAAPVLEPSPCPALNDPS